MQIVIAWRGRTANKTVQLERIDVTPFVGAVEEGSVSRFGLGLLGPHGELVDFYGPILNKFLLQSWRGLKVLEPLSHIWRGTAEMCWQAAGRNLGYSEQSRIRSLSDQIGWERFPIFLREIVGSFPEPTELDQMLRNCETNGIRVDFFEITMEPKQHLNNLSAYARGLMQQASAA